ncbi:BURP domain-containing protein 3 [Acorus gramineus]|uniref:BURP domain-containing protein 3 n=1 Tax=Acorus gramineus TaxID=55184 RepID=A0AAV9B773_ACOGR|nr:BURP domain-containing protein 3 [Acorus gramineus]
MDSKFMVSLILLFSIAAAKMTLSSSDGFPAAAEIHWKTILPHTPMPVVIKQLLHFAKGGHNTAPVIVKYDSNKTYRVRYRNVTAAKQTDATLFFVEDDLKRPGTRMLIRLTKRIPDSAAFLPLKEAKSIPFSTADLPNTLTRLSIKPKSNLALLMQETLQLCEATPLKSEEKHCATSLESMVDFAVSKLGTNKGVQAMATVLEDRKAAEAEKNSPDKWYKWYTVAGTAKEVSDAKTKTLNCHPQTYAYLTYYCHSIAGTRTYVVPFIGDDGTKAEVVAVCHTDTSEWDPKYIAFQMLHVKPGTVPICHILVSDTIVWMTI